MDGWLSGTRAASQSGLGLSLPGCPVPPWAAEEGGWASPALKRVGEKICRSEILLAEGLAQLSLGPLSSLLTVAALDQAGARWAIRGWGQGGVARPEVDKGRSISETVTECLCESRPWRPTCVSTCLPSTRSPRIRIVFCSEDFHPGVCWCQPLLCRGETPGTGDPQSSRGVTAQTDPKARSPGLQATHAAWQTGWHGLRAAASFFLLRLRTRPLAPLLWS